MIIRAECRDRFKFLASMEFRQFDRLGCLLARSRQNRPNADLQNDFPAAAQLPKSSRCVPSFDKHTHGHSCHWNRSWLSTIASVGVERKQRVENSVRGMIKSSGKRLRKQSVA